MISSQIPSPKLNLACPKENHLPTAFFCQRLSSSKFWGLELLPGGAFTAGVAMVGTWNPELQVQLLHVQKFWRPPSHKELQNPLTLEPHIPGIIQHILSCLRIFFFFLANWWLNQRSSSDHKKSERSNRKTMLWETPLVDGSTSSQMQDVCITSEPDIAVAKSSLDLHKVRMEVSKTKHSPKWRFGLMIYDWCKFVKLTIKNTHIQDQGHM